MDKPVCDFCGKPVRPSTLKDSGVCGDWIHADNDQFSCNDRREFATVNGSERAQKPVPPEPIDVDALVGKMRMACWGSGGLPAHDFMLAALRIAAEALGQTERLWPKALEERVHVTANVQLGWDVRLDGNIEGTILDERKALRFREMLIAALKEKEAQSK